MIAEKIRRIVHSSENILGKRISFELRFVAITALRQDHITTNAIIIQLFGFCNIKTTIITSLVFLFCLLYNHNLESKTVEAAIV